MNIEILTRNGSVKIFLPENLVLPTRDNRNQEQDQSSLGDLPQIQTRVDIKKLHAQTSSTAFRRHSFSDDLLRSRNMDTEHVKRTSPDTANHEQNGFAKVYDDKYTFKTNVDNDNSDTTYTNKHKHNMREVCARLHAVRCF